MFQISIVVSTFTILLCNADLPEDRCSSAGDLVCIDCYTVGVCEVDLNSPNAFIVAQKEKCYTNQFCDQTSVSGDGVCGLNGPYVTACYCLSPICIVDPNNSNDILHCETDQSVENCENGVDIQSCSCVHTTFLSTPYFTTKTTAGTNAVITTTASITTKLTEATTASVTESSNTNTVTTEITKLTSEHTATTTSTKGTTPSTSERTESLTSTTTSNIYTTTSTMATPTTIVMCPSCGYIPYDDCSWYIYCKDGNEIKVSCPGISCFNKTTCKCEV